jgi:hypothetical protein
MMNEDVPVVGRNGLSVEFLVIVTAVELVRCGQSMDLRGPVYAGEKSLSSTDS